MTSHSNTEFHIVFYDGTCALCHWAIRMILQYESSNTILFSSLQSPEAHRIIPREYYPDDGSLNTVIYMTLHLHDGTSNIMTHSSAIIAIFRHMRRPFCWLTIIQWVPRPIRDRVYGFISCMRYRLFGRTLLCPIPNSQWTDRVVSMAHIHQWEPTVIIPDSNER